MHENAPTAAAADAWLRARRGPGSGDVVERPYAVSFRYQGRVVTLVYRRHTDGATLSASTAIPREAVVVTCLARLLVWWDLRDGDRILPLAVATLRDLPEPLAQHLLLLVIGDYYARTRGSRAAPASGRP